MKSMGVCLGLVLGLAACDTTGVPDVLSQTYRETRLWITKSLDERPSPAPSASLQPAGCAEQGACRPDRAETGCSAIQPEAAWGARQKALLLGRLARCLETTGQTEAAAQALSRQLALHREFGSVIYPASYYRGETDEADLTVVPSGASVRNCVGIIEASARDNGCVSCRYPIALKNTCNLTVHTAYCTRRPSLVGRIQGCVQFRIANPGEVFVILAGADEVVNPILSFRTDAEQAQWLRDGNLKQTAQ